MRLTEQGDLTVRAEVPTFMKAVRGGWSALVVVVRAGAAAGGFLLPFTPLVLAGWGVRRFFRRPVTRRGGSDVVEV